MKAFEEWNNIDCSSGYCPAEPDLGCKLCKTRKEGTWRAALERIIDQMNRNKFMDNGELRTFIEQELEGK